MARISTTVRNPIFVLFTIRLYENLVKNFKPLTSFKHVHSYYKFIEVFVYVLFTHMIANQGK